jgi:hypothetical protein
MADPVLSCEAQIPDSEFVAKWILKGRLGQNGAQVYLVK